MRSFSILPYQTTYFLPCPSNLVRSGIRVIPLERTGHPIFRQQIVNTKACPDSALFPKLSMMRLSTRLPFVFPFSATIFGAFRAMGLVRSVPAYCSTKLHRTPSRLTQNCRWVPVYLRSSSASVVETKRRSPRPSMVTSFGHFRLVISLSRLTDTGLTFNSTTKANNPSRARRLCLGGGGYKRTYPPVNHSSHPCIQKDRFSPKYILHNSVGGPVVQLEHLPGKKLGFSQGRLLVSSTSRLVDEPYQSIQQPAPTSTPGPLIERGTQSCRSISPEVPRIPLKLFASQHDLSFDFGQLV